MSSMVDKQEIIDMIRVKSPRLELVSFEAGKSEAWRWFKRVRVDGAVLPYAVCNGCFKPVHYTPRDGTGGLRRHACPLTVAMAQAKTGLTPKTPSPAGSASKPKRAETPESHLGQQSQTASSPRSRNQQRRSATVPVSLTMWAAEKGLMDMAAAAAAGLPSGGLSIASAFAALQGIVPRWGADQHPQAHQTHNNGGHPHHQQHQETSSSGHGSPKMADSALDLAMKKSTDTTTTDVDVDRMTSGTGREDDDDDDEDHNGLSIDERPTHHHQVNCLSFFFLFLFEHGPSRGQKSVDLRKEREGARGGFGGSWVI